MTTPIPQNIVDTVLKIGRAEWGSVSARSAAEHGDHVRQSVEMTTESFGQTEPQPMHGLYVEGSETVICHTGTSPNSPITAQALTAAWNHLHDQCKALAFFEKLKEPPTISRDAGSATAPPSLSTDTDRKAD